jgi:hypothetical protein
VNAQDYAWFDGTPLDYAYCLTLVQGLVPDEALRRIDGELLERRTGLPAFIDFAERNFPWAGRDDQRFTVGVAQLDGWVLLLESNGFLGVTNEFLRRLSAETQVVSHQKNVDGEDQFCWMADGVMRLTFEPFLADRRSGTDPDGLIDVMTQVGFDLRPLEERDPSMRTGASFALAEHLTGVRIAQQSLDTAEYACAKAPLRS